MNPQAGTLRLIKSLVFGLALLPALWLAWAASQGQLGANPVETLTHQTGTSALVLLLLTLCITPLRTISGQHWLLRLRRMLGLYSFFYALLHVLTYVVFDHNLDVAAIARDVLKRPFVTLGFAAFVLLLPLAATSFNQAIRWLGGRRWQALHRSVYLIAILVCLHYLWLVKITGIVEPLLYSAATALLLGWRARRHWRLAHGQGI